MSSFGEEDTLFADLGKHEIFTPTKDSRPALGRGHRGGGGPMS